MVVLGWYGVCHPRIVPAQIAPAPVVPDSSTYRSVVTEEPQARRRLLRWIPPLLFDAVEFRRLWIGQSISVLGDQVTLIGLPLVGVLVLGADAAEMGYLTAAGVLPHLLFSLPAGIWLDRIQRRRRLMIAADLGRAALISSIPVAYVLGALSLAQLYLVAFLSGSLAVAFDLSWNTLFVAVTQRERYVEAMALLNGSRSLAYVAGPTVGGLLVQVLGAPLAMLTDAVSYLGSVLFLRRIESPEPPIEHEDGTLRERLLAGLEFILRDPIMRPTLLAVATINLFTFSFAALFILYATTTLGVAPGVLGLALGTGAIGGVIGAVFASRIGRRIGLGPAYALGCLVFPIALILVPVAGPDTSMPVILALLFATEFGSGIGVMILDINVGAIIAARTPDRIRSRAGGAFRFINYGVRPIGAVLGGMLGAAIGVRETLFVVTIAAVAGVLFLVGSPVLRLRELPDAPA
jgi:MFS family permease